MHLCSQVSDTRTDCTKYWKARFENNTTGRGDILMSALKTERRGWFCVITGYLEYESKSKMSPWASLNREPPEFDPPQGKMCLSEAKLNTCQPWLWKSWFNVSLGQITSGIRKLYLRLESQAGKNVNVKEAAVACHWEIMMVYFVSPCDTTFLSESWIMLCINQMPQHEFRKYYRLFFWHLNKSYYRLVRTILSHMPWLYGAFFFFFLQWPDTYWWGFFSISCILWQQCGKSEIVLQIKWREN